MLTALIVLLVFTMLLHLRTLTVIVRIVKALNEQHRQAMEVESSRHNQQVQDLTKTLTEVHDWLKNVEFVEESEEWKS